jgi:hypothetical protein
LSPGVVRLASSAAFAVSWLELDASISDQVPHTAAVLDPLGGVGVGVGVGVGFGVGVGVAVGLGVGVGVAVGLAVGVAVGLGVGGDE